MLNLRNIIQIILLVLCVGLNSYANDEKIKNSENLEIIKISRNCYIHISYTKLKKSDHFPANSLIYIIRDKAYIVDTTWNDKTAKELFYWVQYSLKLTIKGVIVTHWHIDCMGGLNHFHEIGIESYVHNLTCEIAKSRNLPVPKNNFDDSLTLNLLN